MSTSAAAHVGCWQGEYSIRFIESGFGEDMASQCVFIHPGRGIAVSVHGDDFTAVGPKPDSARFEKTRRTHYELTVGGQLGKGPDDDKEGTVVSWVTR